MPGTFRFPFLQSFFRAVIFCFSITAVLTAQYPAPVATAQPLVAEPDGNLAVGKMNNDYVRVWRTIMTPKNVADAFGRRIARRYIAMQVTIANRNKDYQWLIQDASIDLKNLLDQENSRKGQCKEHNSVFLLAASELSDSRVTSADLTVLRGVAEKGQALDPRNISLRSLTGLGVITAGMIGVTSFGPSYPAAVAAFNGPLLDAFKEIFPDYTVEQMNRLNDSAFLANTIVGKQQAKVLVMFIPQPYLLTKKQQKAYYTDPESVYSCADLRLLEANVNGNFITGVTAAPVATAVSINDTEAAKFGNDNFNINGSITGNFFADSTVDLVSPPQGLTVKSDGNPSDKALKFILSRTEPLAPRTVLEFAVKSKNGDQARVVYHVPPGVAPTLASIDPTTLTVGQSTTVTLKGTSFLSEGMAPLFDPSAGLTPGPIRLTSSQEIQFDLAVTATAAEGPRSLRVMSPSGASAQTVMFTVSK
jgi:hypothetical protein